MGVPMAVGRPKAALILTPEQREQLESLASSRSLPAGLVMRARIILLSVNIRGFMLVLCAFGLTLYKTFRRHGLQLLAGLIQPGVADAMEGTVDHGRTHAVCIEAQGRGVHVLVVPGVWYLPGDRL